MLTKQITIISLTVLSVLSITACHQRLDPVSGVEKQMSCPELKEEINKAENVKNKIAKNRGVCGRNAVGLLFWPSIVINEVTGDSAETKASERLVELKNLYAAKRCSKLDCASKAKG